jgi:homoserine O-acetyltransferase
VERALAIGAVTDILFPLQQQEQIAQGLARGGAQAEFVPLESPQGHDAFLVDFARFGPAVAGFLADL